MKNGRQKVIQNHPKSMPGEPLGLIFVIFMVFRRDLFYDVFSFGKKGATNHQQFDLGAALGAKGSQSSDFLRISDPRGGPACS